MSDLSRKAERLARREAKKANRKPFKETNVGLFLSEKAPAILDTIGDILPSNGMLGVVKGLISTDDTLTPEDKEHALELIELDLQEMQEITKRWESDNQQELKLPKLIRPSVLAFTWILLTILIVLNACGVSIESSYIDVFEILALTLNGAYFSARTIEKYHSKKY